MSYVDCMMGSVKTDARAKYEAQIKEFAVLFKKAGALEVAECWGVDVPEGKLTSMPMAVKCAADETVVVSWIIWPSKATRDGAWESMMADEAAMSLMNANIVDGKRMIFGGFEILSKA